MTNRDRRADLGMMGQEIVDRIQMLGNISSEPDRLTRIFLSEEHRKAADLLIFWMTEAGMQARLDAIGNVVGRYEGDTPRARSLLLGSHFDTVRDAGKWDGPLGVITAISCVSHFNKLGQRFPFAIEIVGFADEEGVRFNSTLLGSRALAGTFDESVLTTKDQDGVSMNEALARFGLDPERIGAAARIKGELLAYVELHIEQGPVLENQIRPVGIVSAISGATRLIVTLTGMAGHAGTVPMGLRQDALTGAAECIMAIEHFCETAEELVGTVGVIKAEPGAPNVIAGHVSFTIDMRAPSDSYRLRAVADIVKQIQKIATRRKLVPQIDVTHESRTVPCAPWLKEQLAAAVLAEGYPISELPSGAGHDGMAIAEIADIAMLFVRCRAGLSHHPDEHADRADVAAGARVLLKFIEEFREKA